MRDRDRDVHDVQAVVTLESGIGLALVMIPLAVFARRFANEAAEWRFRSALFLAALGWPCALGFVTRWWPHDVSKKRWLWLFCVFGIPLPLIFLHGLSILIAGVMLVYPWAFWMMR